MPAKLTGDLTKRMRRAEKRVNSAVEAAGKNIAKNAGRRAPVDTGHLSRSPKAERLDDGQVLVTVSTADASHDEYARYVEQGTRHMAAQPFFLPAVEAEREQFRRKVSKALD
jgi:HK97 gp10 family phage protein